MNHRVPLKRKHRTRSRLLGELPVDREFRQEVVDEYFQSNAGYWRSVYRERNLTGSIYQQRQAAALSLVDGLGLPEESNVLEIGCGAGVMTEALARRKFVVHAIDRVNASLELVHRRAVEAGLKNRIFTGIGDVHALDFRDQSFDLVLALGVLPWLHSPRTAMMEISRVLRPGGSAIMTVDNRWRLNHILDPRFNHLLSPVRDALRSTAESLRLRTPGFRPSFPRMHSIKEFDDLLESMGLHKSSGLTLGFGPFTFMGKRVFPDSLGKIVNRCLQQMADWKIPGIRYAGSHYIVVTQKPGPGTQQRTRRHEPSVRKEQHQSGINR